VLIAGDLLIFTILFASYVTDRAKDPAMFESGRRALDAGRGGVNTLVLLTSSWCVAKTLTALREGHRRAAEHWLTAAIGCGAAFVLSKVLEYAQQADTGHSPASSHFFMYYFGLTGLHLAHVVIGCVVLAVFLAKWRSGSGCAHLKAFESAAVFWHMVDLLWIVIFPLLFLVR